ncbi:MAG: thiamine pyrophosphate-dependent dehydrogenase E1 component subunit alpha [Chloroflexi bacterium]|nr:thiamine pyrophosphate-dependent dehydrogenase E1 component subunit alpha [Chloroflexota bacterium]
MNLSKDTLLDMYYAMLRSRRLDERAWVLHRQGKIVFHISGMGHEASQIGAAFALRRGADWLAPYYRDLGLMLCFGLTPREFMLSLFGKQGEVSSGARQMPSHFGLRRANVISTSAPVATQIPHAAGIGLGIKMRGEDAVVLTCIGEGSTSQGEWYEGLNWAAIHKLPVICIVQNNQYAISVPTHLQMAVPNVADRAAAFGMPGVVVDGNDVLSVYRVIQEAADRARRGDGPTLVEAKTYRPVPHSSDDDDRSYRSREEVAEWKKRDPILMFKTYLEMQGQLTKEMNDEYEARVVAEVDDAQKFAEAAPYPNLEWAAGPVYADHTEYTIPNTQYK